MFLFKSLAIAFVTAFVFCNAKSKYLHPRFKGMMIERSYDESTGQCRFFDQPYKEGQTMVPDEDCQYLCTCHVSEYYQGFLCEPLCTQYIDLQCAPGWKNQPLQIPAGPPEFGCICEKMNCVPSLDIEAFLHL